jgi:hypothetical protein
VTHAHHDYVPPADPAVAAKLRAWQDLKFGIIVHFGLYSELGCVESWGLCPEPWVKVPDDDHAAFARGPLCRPLTSQAGACCPPSSSSRLAASSAVVSSG